MRYVVSYDITDARVRRHIVKVCESYGQRVQKSVFECELDKQKLMNMTGELNKARLIDGMEPDDSIRLYPLCNLCSDQSTVLGFDPSTYISRKALVIGGDNRKKSPNRL